MHFLSNKGWREIFSTSQKVVKNKQCFTDRLNTFDVKSKMKKFLLVVHEL